MRNLLLKTSVAAGLFLASAGTAEAASLTGSFSLIGDVEIEVLGGGDLSVDFDADDGISDVVDANGDFTEIAPPTATLTDLVFDFLGGTDYEAPAVAPFIDFGTQTIDGVTSTLTFDLLAPITAQGVVTPTFEALFTTTPFRGQFVFDGTTVGNGLLTAQEIGNSSSYSVSVAAVPEPLTILGSGAALAMGAYLKRRKAA